MAFPAEVKLYEVGPRDGLQNEAGFVPTGTKRAFVERLAATGLKHIEVTSFVSPRWIPQLKDHAELMGTLSRHPDVTYSVLVPNQQGLEGALAAGVDQEICVFAAASETFSQKNINTSIAGSLDRFKPVMDRALEQGIRVRGYISCVLGCPYEETVSLQRVAWVAGQLHDLGCYEISLGDTIGVGTPLGARRMVEAVAAEVPIEQLAVHFHDTYGQALANIYATLELGVRVVDASAGGLGGCPYARGATGNVATEDVVYLLQGMGIESGVDLDGVIEAGVFICQALGRPLGSRTGQARRSCLPPPGG